MKINTKSNLVALVGISIISYSAHSAPSKILMPVTGLQSQSNSPNASPFTKGANGVKIGVLSSIVDLNSVSNTPSCPTDKVGLTDGFQIFSYSLTNDAAISLSFWGKGELSASDKVILYQFSWYKDILDADGTVAARCGAGVQLALKVTNLQANLSLQLPTLAATSQLGQSSITYKINTFGLSGAAIDDAIPNASAIGKFDTESYAAIMQSIAQIQSSYKAGGASLVVTPRLIAQSYTSTTQGVDSTIATQAFALRQIAQGKSCKAAKSNAPDKDASSNTLIEDTYSAITGKGCGIFSGSPTSDTQAKTKILLNKYGIGVN